MSLSQPSRTIVVEPLQAPAKAPAPPPSEPSRRQLTPTPPAKTPART